MRIITSGVRSFVGFAKEATMASITAMPLPDLIAEAHAISNDVKSSFAALTPEQLNWKPDENSWSVAQCLDHLIVINRPYLDIIDNVTAGRYPKTFLHRLPLLPGILGKLLIKSLAPESTRKLKASAKYMPSASSIDAGIVQSFLDSQNLLVEKMKSTRGLDLDTIVITSPVASVVAYSLLDAFRIIVVHEQRHMAQAGRVMQSAGFPSA